MKTYLDSDLKLALLEVAKGSSNYAASKKFKVPSSTLRDHINRGPVKTKFMFTLETEDEIVAWVNKCAARGQSITREQLLDNACDIRRKTTGNPEARTPSIKWYHDFAQRHPTLSLKSHSAIRNSSSPVSENCIRGWFNTIGAYLVKENLVHLLSQPDRILNFDEATFELNPTKPGYALPKKGGKISDSIGAISVMYCFAANGYSYSPQIILKNPVSHVQLQKLSAESAACEGRFSFCQTQNGLQTEESFRKYVRNILVPEWDRRGIVRDERNRVFLFLDYYNSHIGFYFSKWCAENFIELITLYPNAPRILQSCNEAMFSPLKAMRRKEVERWKTENSMAVLDEGNIVKFLKQINVEFINKSELIKSTFRMIGLHPFDAENLDYKPNTLALQNALANNEQAEVLEYGDLEDHQDKCRCCFKYPNDRRKANQITEKIRKLFFEIVQIELKSADLYSTIICETCKKQLEEASEIRLKLGQNQRKLYKFVEGIEDCEFNEDFLNDLHEAKAEPFEVIDVKTEEVVVKVEVIDFDENCVMETDSFDDQEPAEVNIIEFSSSATNKTSVCSRKMNKTVVKRTKTKNANKKRLKSNLKRTKKSNLLLVPFDDNGMFPCDECAKDFKTAASLLTHQQNMHGTDPISCENCGENFNTLTKLKLHVAREHEAQVPCPICQDLKSPGIVLERHIRKVHCDYFKCKVRECRKHFETRQLLVDHLRDVHQKIEEVDEAEDADKVPKGFKLCPECGKIIRYGKFFDHKRAHVNLANNTLYSCDICGNESPSKANISRHILYHKETACKCGKVFPSGHAYVYHRSKEHGEKKTCEICSEMVYSCDLSKHNQKHHTPKVPCEICGNMFKAGVLNKHLKSVHCEKVKCYYEGCGQIVASKSSLSVHIRGVHKDQKHAATCSTCGKSFKNAYRMSIHSIRQHKSDKKPCQVPGCNHSTTRTAYLVMHYKNHKDIDIHEKQRLIKELKSK